MTTALVTSVSSVDVEQLSICLFPRNAVAVIFRREIRILFIDLHVANRIDSHVSASQFCHSVPVASPWQVRESVAG
jgi:hypothetical protein